MPLIDPVTMSGTPAQTFTIKLSEPVELLPTELANIFTNIHPVLLLSVFYVRFPALVADPVTTLAFNLIPLAVIQLLYTIICLPPTGGAAPKQVKKPKSGQKRQAIVASSIFTSIIASLLSLLAIPPLFIAQILFGAPLTTHIPHTLLTSAHVALLAVFPLIYVHGYDGKTWREIVSLWSPVDELYGATLGALFGAWMGAVPIPLDWDREWQKWPVTIVAGAYGGYVFGKVLGTWVLRGRRIELD